MKKTNNLLKIFLVLGILLASMFFVSSACTDTESSADPLVKGYVYSFLGTSSDFCVNENVVGEYYCASWFPLLTYINCGEDEYSDKYCYDDDSYRDVTLHSCEDGACVASTIRQKVEECEYGCKYLGKCRTYPNSCSDSDGGTDPYTFGIVTGYDDDQALHSEDYCLNNQTLREYKCVTETFAYFKDITCPDHCSDGVCY